MKKTWRWFGKSDNITLDMLRQIGVEGIVTALHHIPNGEVWPLDEIQDMKRYIESFGMEWSVVESLPVSEEIKYGGAQRDRLIDNYIKSMENLSKAGVATICYNFMPVIDWVRTDLYYNNEDGTSTLYFDKVRFAYFDCFILKRKDAEKDYSSQEMKQVYELDKTITEKEKEELINTIIVITQGFINGNIKEGELNPVDRFNSLLSLYNNIDKDKLRDNLKYFLTRVIPFAEKLNINLCIHPDDPPFSVLGLPRIVTSKEDIKWILDAVDSKNNGLTFCAGSLSSGAHNNVIELAQLFAHRTHFVHLRSTNIKDNGDFLEASHLEGRGHLIDVVQIFEKINPSLPMRVDHGKMMLGDEDKGYNPGYSFHGRMYALAQMDGVIATVRKISNQ